VETRENTVAQVIDQQRIMELPLNGRQPTQLILLSGAALTAPGGGMVGSKNYFSSTTISVAGGQANGVNYMLDGGDHNDSMTNVNMPIPFPDALQEFSVQTSSLPARFGLHPGAVVNALTKSGTNNWHGDLFEFLRNGDMNARNTSRPCMTASSGISLAARSAARSFGTSCSPSAGFNERGSAAIPRRP
jgi:hypothetical protein